MLVNSGGRQSVGDVIKRTDTVLGPATGVVTVMTATDPVPSSLECTKVVTERMRRVSGQHVKSIGLD